MPEVQGDGYRHLTENIAMGACFRTFESDHEECRKCLVMKNCREATRNASEMYDGVYAKGQGEFPEPFEMFLRALSGKLTRKDTEKGKSADSHPFESDHEPPVVCEVVRCHADGEVFVLIDGEQVETNGPRGDAGGLAEIGPDAIGSLVELVLEEVERAAVVVNENE